MFALSLRFRTGFHVTRASTFKDANIGHQADHLNSSRTHKTVEKGFFFVCYQCVILMMDTRGRQAARSFLVSSHCPFLLSLSLAHKLSFLSSSHTHTHTLSTTLPLFDQKQVLGVTGCFPCPFLLLLHLLLALALLRAEQLSRAFPPSVWRRVNERSFVTGTLREAPRKILLVVRRI